VTPTSASLECLRRAGRIAAEARREGEALVVPGARVRDVCESVEDAIRRRGGGLAFPVQSSRNAIAAHYCPSPEDETVYAEGDLAKLDVGVHVEGWVVDTAVTVNVGGRAANQPLIDAARAALEAAIAAAGPGLAIRRISAVIDATIRGRGFHSVRNLCGHGVGRWVVHCPPPIPNVEDDSPDRLEEGMVVAIEPFATDGVGRVVERGMPEVFRANGVATVPGGDAAVLDAIGGFNGLPFARRQLAGLDRVRVEETLRALAAARMLAAYPPLVDADGRRIAQAEHTVRVGSDGVEVLTD
jgi:methionyl aminopeptidase